MTFARCDVPSLVLLHADWLTHSWKQCDLTTVSECYPLGVLFYNIFVLLLLCVFDGLN